VCVHQVALSELLFVADNLAYFSYQQLDEPLFVMNQIDVIVSTSGSLVLDMFNEASVTVLLGLTFISANNYSHETIIVTIITV